MAAIDRWVRCQRTQRFITTTVTIMIAIEELMQRAVEKTREGMKNGQSPFGCAIARGDEILAVTHNTVVASTDITAHAEVNALRAACQKANDILLTDCIVATTCEPCPMCMSALHWARVATVHYGASIGDADSAGFNELNVPAARLLEIGGSNVKLEHGPLIDECKTLFHEWLQLPGRKVY